MQLPLFVVLVALAQVPGPFSSPPSLSQADQDPGVVQDCVVRLINDVPVPADLDVQQGGGVLTSLRTPVLGTDGKPLMKDGVLVGQLVTEGQLVTRGQVLGEIDLKTALAQKDAAQYRLEAAQKEASNDVNVRYAKKGSAVAEADWESAQYANEKVPGTIPAIEVRRLRLQWEQFILQEEQAVHELAIAAKNVLVREAELHITNLDVERRQVKAPFDGQIVEVFVEEGEWVRSGDPIVRIVSMDRLRVEGYLDATRISPRDVDGKPVVVTVFLPNGEQRQIEDGKVVFASPLVETGGRFKILAEVENPKVDGHWLLRPGMNATMKITWR